MILEYLEVTDFRNIESAKLSLSPGLNLFCGENGAGKTALLEAVHLLGKGRSFRTHRVRNLIRHGESACIVRGTIQERGGISHSMAISRSLREGTKLRLDGEPESRLSALASLLPLQLMLPDVSDLVFGPPSERRQFLDWGLFHVKHGYHGWLRDYLRLLKQRNAWLRSQQSEDSIGVDPWAEQMVGLSLLLHEARLDYVQGLAERLDSTVQRLGLQLNLSIRYEPGWKVESNGENLRNLLAESLPREVKLGSTHIGPHRAEIVILSSESPAAHHVSRGQGKVISSAMNIAQAELLHREQGRQSVFLIDDLGAELDRRRSERLFGLLGEIGCQILASALEPPSELSAILDNTTTFHVKHGEVNPA